MEVKLKTKLVTNPVPKNYINILQLGSTATFTFDLSKQVYSYSDIDQVNFIFKQDDKITNFVMFEQDSSEKSVDSHFKYDSKLDSIIFTLDAEEGTLLFKPSSSKGPVNFEVAVTILNNSKSYTFDYKKDDIYVLNTLYSQVIGESEV